MVMELPVWGHQRAVLNGGDLLRQIVHAGMTILCISEPMELS